MEKSILLHLKIIEKALTDMSKDLHFVRNDNNYEHDFLISLNTLLKNHPLPHPMPSDMKLYILEVLKVCCEFYKADWCGIIVADATSEVWGPAEWYSVKDGPMGYTNIRENEFFEDFPKWVEALKKSEPVILPKIERTIANRHYLRYKAHNLIGVPFTFRPTGFIILRNVERYIDHLDLLNLIVFCGGLLFQAPFNAMTPKQREEAAMVQLNVLGVPSITVMGQTTTAEDYKAPMAWRILAYLALNANPINAADLARKIGYADEDSTAGSIRSVICRLRGRLSQKAPADLITSIPGGRYYLNPYYKISTDAQIMEALWKDAQDARVDAAKIQLLLRAFQLYKGDFCMNISDKKNIESCESYWMSNTKRHYKCLYRKVVNELMERLAETENYTEMWAHISEAKQILPCESADLYYWIIYILMKTNNKAFARERYAEAQNRLMPEEVETLDVRLKEIFDF